MATRSAQRPTLHVPEPNEGEDRALSPFIEPEPPEQTDVDRVAAMLQMAGAAGRASVKIYKVENGKNVFCDSYQPADFEEGDFSMIRDSFGPGVYKIMLYGVHPETGNFGLLTRTEVTIAENRAPTKSGTVAQGDSGMAQLLSGVMEGQKAMLTALMELKQAPTKDPMEEMTRMLTLMTTMRGAMGLDHAPQKSTIGEIVAAVRELRGVAGEIIPDKGGDDNPLTSVMPELLALIRTGMQNNQTPTQQSQPAVMQQMQIPPTLQATQTSVPEVQTSAPSITTEEQNMILNLKNLLSKIIEAASKNEPIEDVADLAYEQAPDFLIEAMLQTDWFDMLKNVAPEVEPHREYFDKVRAEVLRMLREDGAVNDEQLRACGVDPYPDEVADAPATPSSDGSEATGS